MTDPSMHIVELLRFGAGGATPASDTTAAEEPLEIRLGGVTFVVVMRTPGADRELIAGFLLSEQIIRSVTELAAIRPCPAPDAHDNANVLNVWLAGEAAARAEDRLAGRRMVTVNSSCGVCGRRSVEDLLRDLPRVETRWTVPTSIVAGLSRSLRAAQTAFDKTGGLHGAGLFDRSGNLVGVAEDVGRHNAVDKVIGQQLLLDHLPLHDHLLFVSGRTSFEIVQKAVAAGISFVAAVSAPSSLAVHLATAANVTLLGFVRGDGFNLYSAPHRVSG